MSRFSQVICVVLDGVGIGDAPDAARYGDAGSNSIGNTARAVGGLRLPHLGRMGLGNLTAIEGVPPFGQPTASHGVMQPAAAGKDSTTGHWELAGCVLKEPFPTYPDGFPPEIIRAFESAVGRRVIANRPASGTQIITELGAAHMASGDLIVYTSQDSVFQIAAHEKIVSREELYRICETARGLLHPPHGVARVIARPFDGSEGAFYRTDGRRDFSLPPTGRTLLDAVIDVGGRVLAIGKVAELFAGRGVTRAVKTSGNEAGMRETLDAIGEGWSLIFTNLVDFDTMWGHRNDPRAYALGLEEFDAFLPELCSALTGDSLLIITSDHGNDPTTPSTDHSRECVPLLAYCQHGAGTDLGVRTTFADVASTIAEAIGLKETFAGKSFLTELFRR